MNWREYGEALAREGLVADPVLPDREPPSAAWYLQAVSALGAWFAALLILGSVGGVLYGLFEQRGGRAVLGLALCAGAALVMRRRPEARGGAFLAQFSLAVSLAGIGLLGSVLLDVVRPAALMTLVFAALSTALWWLNPEPVHRAMCAFGICASLALALLQWRLEPLATLLFVVVTIGLWLGQARWFAAGRGELLLPLAFAAALTSMLLQVPDTMPRALSADPQLRWLGVAGSAGRAIVLAIGLAVTAVLLARRLALAVSAGHWLALAVACAALAWACRAMPGVIACLLVWLLGSAAGRPRLCALALLALGGYLTMLYYSLAQTLLDKGLLLIATAALLALVAWIVRRWWPAGLAEGARR